MIAVLDEDPTLNAEYYFQVFMDDRDVFFGCNLVGWYPSTETYGKEPTTTLVFDLPKSVTFKEAKRHARRSIHGHVGVLSNEADLSQVFLLDISRSGVSFLASENLELGTETSLTFEGHTGPISIDIVCWNKCDDAPSTLNGVDCSTRYGAKVINVHRLSQKRWEAFLDSPPLVPEPVRS